ncbi:MAG: type VI secretion system ImpA family N-terminal domain-containing protein [Bryobacterales bacterium]|nr:type VI secretion system ImpA family N-terminal domain-containing protein [Bryobacterales bacterium]
MPLRDDILNPIPGDSPGGVSLRYDPVYDKIKEARREEEALNQGAWKTEFKVADWPLVIPARRRGNRHEEQGSATGGMADRGASGA